MWKLLGIRPPISCMVCVAYVSLSYRLPYCVFTDSSGFVHTRAVRRARVEAAFPIILSIYVSNARLSLIAEPRYVANKFEFAVVDGVDTQCLGVLLHGVRLLQTDRPSEVRPGQREAVHQ